MFLIFKFLQFWGLQKLVFVPVFPSINQFFFCSAVCPCRNCWKRSHRSDGAAKSRRRLPGHTSCCRNGNRHWRKGNFSEKNFVLLFLDFFPGRLPCSLRKCHWTEDENWVHDWWNCVEVGNFRFIKSRVLTSRNQFHRVQGKILNDVETENLEKKIFL